MNDYREQSVGHRLTVNWSNAVIQYSVKVFRYGFAFGAAVSCIALVYHGLPMGRAEWVRSILLVISGGMASAGFFALMLLIIKDIFFPYLQPYERIRALDTGQAPQAIKTMPLMSHDGVNSWKYGKHKLDPDKMLLLAQAILQGGETKISQRKLAEWGVVNGKDSKEAKQLKADIVFLDYGIDTGNGELTVTSSFLTYLAQLYPALTPPTPQNRGGF